MRTARPVPAVFLRASLFGVLLCCMLLATGPARAQTASAPYDPDLSRLAEILGGLHHLRTVCGANEGMFWRDEMQSLVDAETPPGPRRNRLVASFNRGYRGFQQSYRTCTPAARVAIERSLEAGSAIARDITSRYGH